MFVRHSRNRTVKWNTTRKKRTSKRRLALSGPHAKVEAGKQLKWCLRTMSLRKTPHKLHENQIVDISAHIDSNQSVCHYNNIILCQFLLLLCSVISYGREEIVWISPWINIYTERHRLLKNQIGCRYLQCMRQIQLTFCKLITSKALKN